MASEIQVPTLGESIVEATISRWLKQEGESVAAGEPLLELETDKVNLEVPSEHAGVLLSIAYQQGDTVRVGDVLGTIGENGDADAAPPDADAAPPDAKAAPQSDSAPTQPLRPDPAATPVAQRIAAEQNLDIRSISGSGTGGRVTKNDVLSHLEQTPPPHSAAPSPPPPPQQAPPPAAPPAPAVPPAADPREERQRMSRRRQTIAQRLREAQHTAAMLTTFNEIDMSAVIRLRRQRKAAFQERHNIGLGFMSFFVKAVVGALKAYPLLNAEIQGDEIVIKHYYDIGIAVGIDQGLVVPVVRDADRKTFAQIEQSIAELAHRARENTLALSELQGGTFSITNGGIYGSLLSTPILNMPQVGILGMHKIEERPVAIAGSVTVRPMMYVALSYDHRIVDGSDAVRFLVRIKELVEDPETLLLEG